MTGRLEGKVAIVSGAGTIAPGWGNGKAAAVLFAREGARVFAVDRDLAAVRETQSIIAAEQGTCSVHQADVSIADDVRQLVQHCIDEYGRVDILHNNVGINGLGGAVETTEETWDRIMTVNVKSMFLMCKEVLPHMLRQGGTPSHSLVHTSRHVRWRPGLSR